MSDQTQDLEPGAMGRLTVLIAEMRAMRKAIEQLGAQLAQLGVDAGGEFGQVRDDWRRSCSASTTATATC